MLAGGRAGRRGTTLTELFGQKIWSLRFARSEILPVGRWFVRRRESGNQIRHISCLSCLPVERDRRSNSHRPYWSLNMDLWCWTTHFRFPALICIPLTACPDFSTCKQWNHRSQHLGTSRESHSSPSCRTSWLCSWALRLVTNILRNHHASWRRPTKACLMTCKRVKQSA